MALLLVDSPMGAISTSNTNNHHLTTHKFITHKFITPSHLRHTTHTNTTTIPPHTYPPTSMTHAPFFFSRLLKVVVSRVYGGQHIGKARFEHMCARESTR